MERKDKNSPIAIYVLMNKRESIKPDILKHQSDLHFRKTFIL